MVSKQDATENLELTLVSLLRQARKQWCELGLIISSLSMELRRRGVDIAHLQRTWETA